MRRTAVAIAVAFSVSACGGTIAGNMAECEMEAMKQFGQLRKPHPVSGILWPTSLEHEYRESCMEARGFRLNYEKAERDKVSVVGITSELMWPAWRWDPAYWKRDFSRYLPTNR